MLYTNINNKYLPDGGITDHYNMTDLIDNIMVYWVSGSITSSMRIYKEMLSGVELTLEQWVCHDTLSVPNVCEIIY